MAVKLEATVLLADEVLESDPYYLRTPWLAFDAMPAGNYSIASVTLRFSAWVIGYGDSQASATYPGLFGACRAQVRLAGNAVTFYTSELPQHDHFVSGQPLPREGILNGHAMTLAPDGGAWTAADVDGLAVMLEQGATYLRGEPHGRVAWFCVNDAWLEVAALNDDSGSHELIVLRSALT